MTDLSALANYLDQPDVSKTVLADGSGVLLDIAASQVITLNETSVFLTEAIQAGASDTEQLVQQLVDAYDVDEATAHEDVARFIDMLSKHLLTTASRQGE